MAVESFLKKAKEIEKQKKSGGDPPPKKHQDNHDESNWLVSYADMMTLLCAFFIMLLSMSKMNAPQYEKVKRELATQFGGKYISPTIETADFFTQIIEELGIERDTVVTSDDTGVSLIFESSVMFEATSSILRPEGTIVINRLIDAIIDKQETFSKRYNFLVEGHTDSRPITSGRFASNWELSSARAASVARTLIEKGVSPRKIAVIGYGSSRQKHKERNEFGAWDPEALKKNRRVVVRILEPNVDTIPFEHYTTDRIKKAEGTYKDAQSIMNGISEES